MRKPITNAVYTQVNTNSDDYLVQNISKEEVFLLITADNTTPPAADAQYDIVLKYTDGITNNDVIGIVWAKSSSPTAAVGYQEA